MAESSERRQKDPARVTLKNVRLSFASLFKAKPFGGAGRGGDDGGEPKFQGNFLLDPTTRSGKANIAKVEAAIDHAIESHNWGGKAPKFAETKLPLRDGENVDYEGYEGTMYVSSNNAKRPKVFDQDKEEVTHESDEGAPYSGCYVDAIVRIWAQDNKWGKRINASLEAVRFREDGDAFGAAQVNADDFDDDEDDEDRPARSKRSRDDDDDRGGRSSRRDDDEKPSRRSRDEDDEKPRRSRDEDDDRPARRGRDEDDDRPARRSNRDDDERPARRSSRDDDDERPSRRGRDDDEEDRPRQRRSRDDDERPRSRRRDDDDVV